jgi:hypothetical protein
LKTEQPLPLDGPDFLVDQLKTFDPAPKRCDPVVWKGNAVRGSHVVELLLNLGIHPVGLDKTVEGITAASAAFLALMLSMPSKMIAASRASERLLVDAFDEIFDDNFQRLDRR